MNDARTIQLHKAILRELGHEIGSNSTILDFGCGEGKTVHQYRKAGFNAFGADILLHEENDFLRLISIKENYRIPFDNETFDFVFSEQVLEHARNYRQALSEIHRVLKPHGFSLHIFPSKFKPIEPHVFVPFAGMFRPLPWLLLWARLGIRNSFQKGRSYREVADRNFDYLRNNTSYMSKDEIRAGVLAHFDNVTFAEKYLIKHSYGHARRVWPIVRIFPFLASLYSSLHCRVIFFKKH
jgi:ubiquinone/menaquinone biosynthesis C-methylase UbiE